VLLVAIYFLKRKKFPADAIEIPYIPHKLPILGHLLFLLRNNDDIFPHYLGFLKTLGRTWKIRVFNLEFIMLNDPEHVKHILSTKFGDVYEKGERMQEQYQEFFGEGIFMVNGKAWKDQRTLASTIFHTSSMKDNVNVFTKTAHMLIDKIQSLKTPTVDMQDYFMRYTLESFGEIGFGVSLGSIHEEVNEFQIAFDYIQYHSERRGQYGPMWKYLAKAPDFNKHLKYLNDYTFRIINEKRAQSMSDLEKSNDLLAIFLRTNPNASDKELRDFVVNFLIAGRDTTATLLTWCVYLLSQHPHVEQKVREEMESVFGPATESNKDYLIQFADLKKLRYTRQVLQETLRLYPPVPIDGYTAIKDDILPGGYFVRKDSIVRYSAYLLGRNPDYWPEPEKFLPERFDTPPIPFTWVPFHGGPRTCLGQDMAIYEAQVMLSILFHFRKVKLSLADGYVPKLRRGIILTAQDGMPMKISSV
jgi:cytochrome P450